MAVQAVECCMARVSIKKTLDRASYNPEVPIVTVTSN